MKRFADFATAVLDGMMGEDISNVLGGVGEGIVKMSSAKKKVMCRVPLIIFFQST